MKKMIGYGFCVGLLGIGFYSCTPQSQALSTGDSIQTKQNTESTESLNLTKNSNKDSHKDSVSKMQADIKQKTTAIVSKDSSMQQNLDNTKNSHGLKFTYKDLAQSETDYNYTGVVRLYYDNGMLAWEISFKDGKQDGWTKWYYDNGKVRTQMFFVNGNADGESLWYYRHGVVREQGMYANDLANGESKIYTPSGTLKYKIFYKDGYEVRREEYDSNGRIIANN